MAIIARPYQKDENKKQVPVIEIKPAEPEQTEVENEHTNEEDE